MNFDITPQPKKSFFEKVPFGGIQKPSFFNQPKQEDNFEMNENDTDLIDSNQGTSVQYTGEDVKEIQESPDTPTLEKQESQPSKTSFTTANGDGLTFDPFSMNIFDEIQEIIQGPKVVPKKPEETPPKVEEQQEDFLMEDIPDNLQPHSVLIEIIEQMEHL